MSRSKRADAIRGMFDIDAICSMCDIIDEIDDISVTR